MAHILDVLAEKVLLCDGGMGALTQAMDLDADKDFWGHENCTDILVRSRPDLIRDIHKGYYAAGADMAITDTFGASPVTLGEFGLADEAFALNKAAAELAREAAESFPGDGRDRFVLRRRGAGNQAAQLGPRGLRHPGRGACRPVPGAHRRRRRRHPHRDLPGPAPDQGRRQRRQAGHRRGGHPHLRPGDGGDHGHPAGGRRHRRRGDGGQGAGRAADGHQLRHRPPGDGRPRQVAGGKMDRPGLGTAQRRPARTGGRPPPLSPRAG